MARLALAPAPQESVTCNVVPLLDVMFLLMIFLMLGSDMSVRDSAELNLPTASEAKDQPAVEPLRFVTLNVVRGAADAWTFSMQGREFDAAALPDRLAAVAQDATEPAEGNARPLSAVTLSIRSDRAAPYGLVQTALAACGAAGIHRTEVAAAKPAAN